jgi:peptide/nickel transport system permease protein
MFRHILPNALAPVLVSGLGIASAILASRPQLLGVGVPADTVTWGSILNEARSNTFAWWLAVFPSAAIFVAVISYYMVGEGLRDALDPRLK